MSGAEPESFLVSGGGGCPLNRRNQQLMPSFQRPASRVLIRRAADYQRELGTIILESLKEFQLPVRGKTVLLKPNLVGLDPLGVMNTHPAVIAATRESFLRLGASEVFIGDGPAMDRDTESILQSVKLKEFTGPLSHIFRDLNLDDVSRVPLPTRASRLRELFLPRTVLGVDFLVSIAKFKTHHWAGVTLSLKNMFGVVPGACYGWPKNVLHWAGIDNSILDINAVARPDFAIIDGIVGMEGNGPIQGTPKATGVLILGNDPVAVDATACRVMGLKPDKVSYLAAAGTLLGHLDPSKIHQVGETIESVRTSFAVLDEFQQLVA
jgi:uncharacterized protein (DUF362 family)